MLLNTGGSQKLLLTTKESIVLLQRTAETSLNSILIKKNGKKYIVISS